MQLHLHFVLLNSAFDREMADALHQGKESEDNIRNLWEDEFTVAEPVTDFKIRNNSTYVLEGLFPDNRSFRFEIPGMTICECSTESGKTMQFAVSKKLLKNTEKITKKDKVHLYFYLRDTVEHENPMDGLYIASEDFPGELKRE